MVHGDFERFAQGISRLCGWVYVLAWSLSFYPQPTLNIRQRSTKGLVPDFPFLNVIGFACYTLSTTLFLFSPTIRREYALRHPVSREPTVRFNDFAFGAHAVVLTAITYSQFWPPLWGWEKVLGVRRRASRFVLGVVYGCALAITIVIILVLASGHDESNASSWLWLDVIYALTYVKLLLTLIKYCPQVLENYRRKSTVGWAIHQVLLDLTGGLLSIVQLVIDSSLQADWSGLMGNPVKFGLANISMAFDIIFIAQHYVLYRDRAMLKREDDGIEDGGGSSGAVLDGEQRPLLPQWQSLSSSK